MLGLPTLVVPPAPPPMAVISPNACTPSDEIKSLLDPAFVNLVDDWNEQ